MKLYEIKQRFADFMDEVERGLIPEDAISDTLDSINYEFYESADNIACIIKDYKTDIDAIKEEISVLQGRVFAKTKVSNRLRDYLLSAMKAVGKNKIETSRNVLSVRKNPASVVFGDEDALMTWLFDNGHKECIKTEVSLLKSEIGALLKSGEEIPHVQLVSGERIEIK